MSTKTNLDKCDGKLPYRYERGEGRKKHCWDEAEAGFRPGKRGEIGKCSNLITDTIAQQLLEHGLIVPPDDDSDEQYPQEIFNIYRGVIYVAVPTRPGISYHGYPYKGKLTKRVYEKLEERSVEQQCNSEFKKWAKTYIDLP
jgi:hypothetical protein